MFIVQLILSFIITNLKRLFSVRELTHEDRDFQFFSNIVEQPIKTTILLGIETNSIHNNMSNIANLLLL